MRTILRLIILCTNYPMRKKVLYSSLVVTSIFVLISLYFSKFHPISIFGRDEKDIKFWEFLLYDTFEFYGSFADTLHMITGLPTFIYYVLLFFTIWAILYLNKLLLFFLFKRK